MSVHRCRLQWIIYKHTHPYFAVGNRANCLSSSSISLSLSGSSLVGFPLLLLLWSFVFMVRDSAPRTFAHRGSAFNAPSRLHLFRVECTDALFHIYSRVNVLLYCKRVKSTLESFGETPVVGLDSVGGLPGVCETLLCIDVRWLGFWRYHCKYAFTFVIFTFIHPSALFELGSLDVWELTLYSQFWDSMRISFCDNVNGLKSTGCITGCTCEVC